MSNTYRNAIFTNVMPQLMLRTAALTLLIAASLTACTTLEKDNEIQSANQIPKNGAPIYPKESRNAGEEGTVFVRVLVGKSGDPVEVKVSKSSGFKALARIFHRIR